MDYHPVILTISKYLSFILLAVNLQGTTFLIILLIALLLLVFTISGAEVALFSLTGKDINMLKTKQHTAAKRIINLLEERKTVYTSMLIATTFFNICIILLSNFLITEFLPFEKMFSGLNGFAPILELIIKVFIISFGLIFFGKILPKVWATQNNLRFAYGASFVVESLHLILRRISTRMVTIADSIGT